MSLEGFSKKWYNLTMKNIGKMVLGKAPAIALAVSDKENSRTIKASGADLLEIRVDQFARIDPAHIRDTIK